MPHYLSGIKEDDWENFVSRIIEDQNSRGSWFLPFEETSFEEPSARSKLPRWISRGKFSLLMRAALT